MRCGATSRRLIFKLADVADKHRTSVDERRAQFVVSVERAATLTRTSVDRRHPAEMLALSIIAEIRLRRRLAGIVEPDDFGWPGTDGDPWPTDEIQAELEKLKPPNSARAIDRRGGRSAFGPDAVAASLSRRFALFGDRSSQSNEAVAEKFKAARRRVVTQLSKKKGDESSPP